MLKGVNAQMIATANCTLSLTATNTRRLSDLTKTSPHSAAIQKDLWFARQCASICVGLRAWNTNAGRAA
jgi:hypothetical protein